MLPRYMFHKESKEDLKEFLEAAAELQKDNPDNYCHINKYLNEVSFFVMLFTSASLLC